VSFGGSALITTMLATGILVNVARQSRNPGHAAPRTGPRVAARR
jgi:cell division protein FtsW (lipid II flippase)